MANFANEPVLGQAGIQVTMSDLQALAYCFLALEQGLDPGALSLIKIPPGYTYPGPKALVRQAVAYAKEILG